MSVDVLLGNRKILVTGGAGYIGCHVVQRLLDDSHKVLVFDNFATGERENIDPRAEVITGDVRSHKDLSSAFTDDIGMVFHFAALKAAGESMVKPGEFADNNITGTLNLIEHATSAGVSGFVFSSSAAVYGTPERVPLDETHPTRPDNYYGYTKLAIEENLGWYDKLKGLKFAALRYFNATGYDLSGRISLPEKNPGKLCPILMEVASGARESLQVFGDDYDTEDGTCVRDYIHVDDLVDAHIRAMNYLLEKSKSITVNLGTGSGYSVLEMLKALEKVCGKAIPHQITKRRPGDPPILIATSDRAKQALGWEAIHSDIETIFKSMCRIYGI